MPSSADGALAVLDLVSGLPYQDLQRLADALAGGTAGELRQRTSSARVRDALSGLLELDVDLRWAGGLVLGSAIAAERAGEQRLDVVWTGPASAVLTSRLTAPVVSALLAEAQQEVLLIGYAVQSSAGVAAALSAAASRGVSLTLLLERGQDNANFSQHGAPLAEVSAARLVWPSTHREAHASLHAKVLVVDRRLALVGSANLTGAALERNLECGLLLRGGPEPARICEHIESLVNTGVLLRL